jgi:hypothetical protein
MSSRLASLPPEIKAKMCERQVEQGNPADVSKLFRDRHGGGFSWKATSEGSTFWRLVYMGDFTLFYKVYPKTSEDVLENFFKL